MSDEPARDVPTPDGPAPDEPPTEFDWQSPRWREGDESQAESEREHRFRDDEARPARGAIDRGDSVGRQRKPERPKGAEEA